MFIQSHTLQVRSITSRLQNLLTFSEVHTVRQLVVMIISHVNMVAIGTLNEHDCSKRLGALEFKVDVVLFSGLFILVVFNGNIWWAAEASTVTYEEVKQWCNISNIFASMICHPLWIFLNLFSFIDCCFKIENLLWISEARQGKIVVQTYVFSRIIL